MKKLWFKIITLAIALSTIIFAQTVSAGPGLSNAFSIAKQTASGSYETGTTFESMLGDIILLVLSLLGIVFIIFIIYAGWLWMSANGNEQKVEKARGILIQSIIGLIIVLGAYALSYFIIGIFNSQFNN